VCFCVCEKPIHIHLLQSSTSKHFIFSTRATNVYIFERGWQSWSIDHGIISARVVKVQMRCLGVVAHSSVCLFNGYCLSVYSFAGIYDNRAPPTQKGSLPWWEITRCSFFTGQFGHVTPRIFPLPTRRDALPCIIAWQGWVAYTLSKTVNVGAMQVFNPQGFNFAVRLVFGI
jgi:hypothetical protein